MPAPAIEGPVADSAVSDVPVAEHSVKDAVDEAPASSAAPVALVGTQTILRDRYILHDEIGRGGAGIVYLAFDRNRAGLPHDQQYVALKVVRDEHARRPETLHALRREFHQAQSLSHPGIVNVFDFDHDGDTYFVTMELLDGEPLGQLMSAALPQPLARETAYQILGELGDAIAYAHERDVLHLDLKPGNVMVLRQGHVRVLDFGLAQTFMAEPWISDMPIPAAATPAYASCERLVGDLPDVRDDIFSFACLAYEVLSGRHPFGRGSALEARGKLVPSASNRPRSGRSRYSRRSQHRLRTRCTGGSKSGHDTGVSTASRAAAWAECRSSHSRVLKDPPLRSSPIRASVN
jgi:serine/threonine protein kinase